MFRLIPSLLYWMMTFTSITLPTSLFTLFSTSLTFTLNATTLMLIVLAFASSVSWIVRYRFLNMYARLPPEPQRKEPEVEVFPETQGDSKQGFANYLDEFLSAIKVFGYLDRPVFHELTRTMQTRKLRAGETLLLEEEQGFCVVVDGLVQIFVKSSRESDLLHADVEPEGSDEEDRPGYGNQGYALLTEVQNGAPMSSLFSILSLFTEDIQLRLEDEEDIGLESGPPSAQHDLTNYGDHAGAGTMESMPGSSPTSPNIVPDSPSRPDFSRERSSPSMNSTSTARQLPEIPPFNLEPESRPRTRSARAATLKSRQATRNAKSPHPDILARAKVDTTIAIIPASAFRRLTRLYPKATAHIVQVILARFQRVTLASGHSYLGLTSEILRTEMHMNKYTTYELPNFLRGSALDRLKQKFSKEKERVGQEDVTKGIALHNGLKGHRKRSGKQLAARAFEQSRRPPPRRQPSNSISHVRLSPLAALNPDRHGASPGDLLADVRLSRQGSIRERQSFSHGNSPGHNWHGSDLMRDQIQTPIAQFRSDPFVVPPENALHRQESLDEDSMFRISVLECIFKAIGLSQNRNSLRKARSGEQSPKLVSYDSKRQVAVFNNAFGLLNPYEESAEGDSDSVISASISAYSSSGAYTSSDLREELRDDIEIVYFPKGSVLVEQGERNPGLYYLIDGFLDVSIPAENKEDSSDVLHTTKAASYIQPRGTIQRPTANGGLSSSSGLKLPKSRRNKQAASQSLFMIKPGGIAGYIGTVSSYRSFVDVKAETDVYVGFLPRRSLERIVERFPIVLLTMAKRLTSLLPRLIRHIDFALEWVQVNAGQIIYQQHDESDAIYIVLNGRLRLIHEKEGGEMKVLDEYGQGESVGELEVMTETARPGTLHAIRDTELAKLPKSLFNTLALEHSGITMKISKIIASRMRTLVEERLVEGKESLVAGGSRRVNTSVNLRTVAILPVTAGVPVVEFGSRLLNALSQIGVPNRVASLNQAAILNHLGRHAFSRMGKLKLSQYLADLEEKYGMVLYIVDTNVTSAWTQTCISQADCILLVGIAEDSPDIGEYERFLLGMKTTARKELVLLHPDRYLAPGLTRKWLRVS